MSNELTLIEQWPRIVSASVAPVVVISACALMCLAFYNRLAAIISRLRSFQRERLAEQEHISRMERAEPPDVGGAFRRRLFLDSLAEQTHRTLRRARLIRMTLLSLLGTIALLVVSSVLNGLSVLWPGAVVGATVLFLAGLGLMLLAIGCAMAELFSALDVVEAEMNLVTELAPESAA